MQYDIFISYKRLGISSATAAYIYDLLTKKGYSVFFDRKEIRQGRFNEQLLTHIEGAQDIFVLLEQNSLNSCFNGIAGSYQTDWFCMEIMHALKNKKRIIPLLLDGYKMPAIQELPSELKNLALENAISFDASDIDDFYKKYLIDQGYLQSKPRNLFISNLNGAGIADFLFYSDGFCDLYEFGNMIGRLDQNVDEQHPYIYTVKRAGEHRFNCKNNDTCETQSFTVSIDKDTQKYVPIQWKFTQNLWELTPEDIENQADSNILFFWGKGLFEGTSTHEPQLDLSFLCLQKAAKQWNLDARNYIVDNVNTVVNKRIEKGKVISWLEMAAEFDSDVALFNLGQMFLVGSGIEQNGRIAFKYFEKAASLNNDDAKYRIGWMYTEGIGVRRNYFKGRVWYEIAAQNEHPLALLQLGEIFQYGRGIKPDCEKALEYYKRAVPQRPSAAYVCMGSIYYLPGKYHDYSRAFDYFKKASEQGEDYHVAVAKMMCANMMKKGEGTKIDISGAEKKISEVNESSYKFEEVENYYNNIAWYLYLMGVYEEALPLALKAVSIKENPSFFDTLGNIYRAMGDYDNALKAYNRCVALGKLSAKQDIKQILRLKGKE